MSAATLERPTLRSAASHDLDLVLEHVSPGEAVFSTTSSRTYQHRGSAPEAGPCRTLLDFALSAAVQSLLTSDQSYRPVELVMTPVHAPVPGEGRLEASARVVRSGCGLLVATGAVRGPRGISVTGRLVALASLRT